MRKLIASLILCAVATTGCGTLFGSNERTVPSKNHKLCGVAGGAVAGDAILLVFAVLPGVVAFGVDLVTGGLWMSDNECRGK